MKPAMKAAVEQVSELRWRMCTNKTLAHHTLAAYIRALEPDKQDSALEDIEWLKAWLYEQLGPHHDDS